MAGELKHADVGTGIENKEEWESIGLHVVDGQALGDLLIFGGTYWQRLAKGTEGKVLTAGATVPEWTESGGVTHPRTATLVLAASNTVSPNDADDLCTGTQDHEVKINQALAAAGSGSVLLRAGTYYINAPIDYTAHKQVFKGEGDATKIINNVNNRMVRMQNFDHCRCQDMWLNGKGAGANLDKAVFMNNVKYPVVTGLRINNSGAASIWIEDYASIGALIAWNKILGGADSGIEFVGTYHKLLGNTIRDRSGWGIFFNSSQHVLCAGNFVSDMTQGGICLIACSDSWVMQNWATLCKYGIEIMGIRNHITHNFVYYIVEHGIYSNNGKHNDIDDNWLWNNGQGVTDTYSHIYLGGVSYSTHNKVNNNRIYDMDTKKCKYGILEASSSDDYNMIHANMVEGPITDGILKQGTNSVESDNMEI